MKQIVECVANFSEGRRDDVVTRLIEAIETEIGVIVLDHSQDFDHNRCVISYAGPPQPVCEAAFKAIKLASELIDLTRHEGVHPRVGAADVIPLIPVHGVSLEECALLAQKLGQRVAAELDLPVYLYEAAARRPDRTNLAEIRKGGYETLKRAIETDPARQPDYGPSHIGPAGAVVIGARRALIAFNLFLSTDDVNIARHIATKIRASDGGLPAVKALGLYVGGQAQVSINLTDYQVTPLYRVVEAVTAEAAAAGVRVSHGELIGLIPQDAVFAVAGHALYLPELSAERVLEPALLQKIGFAFEA